MSMPAGIKIRMMDARCPHCMKLLFRAAENTELVGTIEIKCSCGTTTTYRPGKLRLMDSSKLPKH